MTHTQFETIPTWQQLFDHIRAGYDLFYQAPMDVRPVRVSATIRKDGLVRVYPPSADADPFNADPTHLPRFKRHADRHVTA